MLRFFHTSLGVFLLLAYIYLMTHLERFLPGLAAARDDLGVVHAPKLSRGLLVLYGLPLAAIACFIFPERLKWWLSPRPPPEFDYLLTEPVWYLLGYVLITLSAGLLLLFR